MASMPPPTRSGLRTKLNGSAAPQISNRSMQPAGRLVKKKKKLGSRSAAVQERSCRCTQNPNLLRPCGGMASPPSRPDASRERRLNMDDPRGGHPGISFAQDPAGKILLTGVPQDTPNYGRFKNGDVIISVDNTPVGGFTVQQVPSDHDDARYCRITMQRCLFFAALLFFLRPSHWVESFAAAEVCAIRIAHSPHRLRENCSHGSGAPRLSSKV